MIPKLPSRSSFLRHFGVSQYNHWEVKDGGSLLHPAVRIEPSSSTEETLVANTGEVQ